MVAAGEVDALVAERVWQEVAKGLMEAQPSRMFEVLRECGALVRLMPEVDRLWGVPQRADYHPEVDTGVHLLMVLDMSAELRSALPVRYACLTHDLGKGTTPADILPRHLGHEDRSVHLAREMGQRLRVPNECSELAELVAREHGNVHRSDGLNAAAVVRLLDRCDAFRKPERFADALLACECDARGRLGLQQQPYPQRPALLRALDVARTVDTSAVAAQAMARGQAGQQIAQAIHHERIQALLASHAAAASTQPS
jgi:tRNA nucleotidyltransferase (CCA-adding enzyme)